jgi:hypothetical protein
MDRLGVVLRTAAAAADADATVSMRCIMSVFDLVAPQRKVGRVIILDDDSVGDAI